MTENGVKVGPRLNRAGDMQMRLARYSRSGLVVGTTRVGVSVSLATSLRAPNRAATRKEGGSVGVRDWDDLGDEPPIIRHDDGDAVDGDGARLASTPWRVAPNMGGGVASSPSSSSSSLTSMTTTSSSSGKDLATGAAITPGADRQRSLVLATDT
jgi:hypothetical protein